MFLFVVVYICFKILHTGVADRLQALEDAQLKLAEVEDAYGDLDIAMKDLEEKVTNEQTSGTVKDLDSLRVSSTANSHHYFVEPVVRQYPGAMREST